MWNGIMWCSVWENQARSLLALAARCLAAGQLLVGDLLVKLGRTRESSFSKISLANSHKVITQGNSSLINPTQEPLSLQTKAIINVLNFVQASSICTSVSSVAQYKISVLQNQLKLMQYLFIFNPTKAYTNSRNRYCCRRRVMNTQQM